MTKNTFSTLIVFVQNHPGVLFRISGLIRRRRFNIESLTVSHTETAGISRFTILVKGDRATLEKMSKQLYRLIEVLKIIEPEEENIVARELGLFKVSLKKQGSRGEITDITKHFRGRLISVKPEHVTIEISGSEYKIDGFYENMKKFGIIEFIRTGRTALFK